MYQKKISNIKAVSQNFGDRFQSSVYL